jgi:hypothetical protein
MEKLDVFTKTKTCTYILPMLSMELSTFKGQVVNAFLGDNEQPQWDNHIFVLFKFSAKAPFIEYEKTLEGNHLYAGSYDPDDRFVMKVFKVPERFQEDYNKFKDSKFSQISNELKTRIVAFHQLPQDHPIVDVLYKREAAFQRLEAQLNGPGVSEVTLPRHLEASSKLDLFRELYSPEYISKNPLEEAKGSF